MDNYIVYIRCGKFRISYIEMMCESRLEARARACKKIEGWNQGTNSFVLTSVRKTKKVE